MFFSLKSLFVFCYLSNVRFIFSITFVVYITFQFLKEALKCELGTLNDQLIKKNSQLTNISKKTNEVIKNYFPDFDLDLFNSEEKETIAIREKDIELQFLNYANKMNIVYKINEFLKNRINIQSFDLVDHIESINDISIYDDVQIIACRVTYGKILKLNEQDIN